MAEPPQRMEQVDGMNLSSGSFPILFKHRIDDIRLKRGDDILMATYPRTGTTWLSQIVRLLLAGEDKYDEIKKTPLHEQVLFFEMKYHGQDYSQIELLDTIPTPRADKTHLSYRFIKRWLEEDKVKTIVTTRNPKDTLVSMFHFQQNIKNMGFSGSWSDFFDKVVKADQLIYSDQCTWYMDWDKNKGKGEVLYLKYEAMKQDIVPEIKKIAAFLDIKLSDSLLEKIVHDVNIKQMKNDNAIGQEPELKDNKKFVRKGQSGEWKKYFTVEQNEWFDNKYKKLYENLSIDVDYC